MFLKYSWLTTLCYFLLQNSDFFPIHFKMITKSLIMICIIKLLLSYWLYFPHSFYHHNSFIFLLVVIPFNFLQLFISSPHSFSFGIKLIFLCDCLCFAMFDYWFCFLDSTYTWNHTVFVSDISFSIIPSRSIHVVTNSKI